MFVRWKRKRRKDAYHGKQQHVEGLRYTVPVYEPETLITAVLVESYRNDAGQPRQRTVKYLASIRERMLQPDEQAGILHRGRFWVAVTAALDGLALDTAARHRVTATIARTVPHPDRDHLQAAQHQHEQEMARLTAMIRAL